MMRVGIKTVKDHSNLGMIDVHYRAREVEQRRRRQDRADAQAASRCGGSSTCSASGASPASGFPGESAGILTGYEHWRPIGQATMAYGYGLSVTPLQLAQAYAMLGAGGIRRPISLRKPGRAASGRARASPSRSRRNWCA